MIKENVKIMNWRNGFLLSLVSYILYLIIWLILDDETANQLPGMATVDYVVDFLLCMLFTYISLGFSYLVFKILPFRTSYVWVIVYASCLLTLNNLVAFGIINQEDKLKKSFDYTLPGNSETDKGQSLTVFSSESSLLVPKDTTNLNIEQQFMDEIIEKAKKSSPIGTEKTWGSKVYINAGIG